MKTTKMTTYSKIEPRRVIRTGSDLDILNVIKFDDHRFSIRVFGYEDWGHEWVAPSTVAAHINEFVPTGIIYRSPFRDLKVRGEDLHESLVGQVLYGIGEYCIDYGADRWNMHSVRDTKNLWMLTYDLDTRAVRPVFVYPETFLGKWGRDALGNHRRSLGICQIRLPFADSKITDAHIRLYTHRPLVIGDTATFQTLTAGEVDDYYTGIADHTACDGQPHLKLACPDSIPPGGVATAKIQLTTNRGDPLRHKGVNVYLKSNSGYLPHRQIPLSPTTGKATFQIHALGLTPGDHIEIKAGFKHYSNIVSAKITIKK